VVYNNENNKIITSPNYKKTLMNIEIVESKSISGWGRNTPVSSNIVIPKQIKEIQDFIKESQPKSIIPRGLGRSYGDAAQLKNKNVLDLKHFSELNLHEDLGTLTAGAGASFNEILKHIVQKGFFLPVSPGTRNVTVGGAIASDVHGKNHHVDGSFGNHVLEIKLIDGLGNLKILTPDNKDQILFEQFWSTIGGMGLTGVIIEATFKLIKIETSLISVDTSRYGDLESLMDAMLVADKKYRYSVAWVDSLHPKSRGVLTCGDHAKLEELESITNKLQYDPKSLTSTPSFLPNGLLNKLTVRLFNETWFRKSPQKKEKELQSIAQFFHPLDGVKDWNKIYGPKGFVQYQFAIPDESAYLVSKTLRTLKEINAPSFLTVLKRFGENNKGYLSFPISGWTLAVDVPAGIPNLNETLVLLDNEIANKGGRIYLAKDSRQSSEMFLRTYNQFKKWQKVKKEMDPKFIFTSDLAERYQIN
tara:strand:- start:1405 stop:2826 length:1422 start_codon:yes stop_codon:yes gene_type:complete